MRRTLAIFLAIGFCLAGSGLVVSNRRAARSAREAAQQSAWQKAKAERAAELELARNPPRPAKMLSFTPAIPERFLSDPEPTWSQNPRPAALSAQSAAKPALPNDTLARDALSLVGIDPEADEIWAQAINDPDLPPQERKNLIKDLNKVGFPGKKNLTMNDLPLIMSRIALIEEHGPDAMDGINAAAFAKAYKDLLKKYTRLIGW